MQKISYTGDGKTSEFRFDFPFFDICNIIVQINNQPATEYNIITTPGTLDSDFPYIGGSIVFATAPGTLDYITITRQLPLARHTDYQPLSPITPTLLNQDLNYLIEIAKDFRDKIVDIETKYSAIIDQESTQNLLSKFDTIHTEITEFYNTLVELGDIDKIQQNIQTNTNNISNLTNKTNDISDYVIASQTPTAENNYTWYRKYKSGWVEQGGLWIGNSSKILPIAMQNANYSLFYSLFNNEDNDNLHLFGIKIQSQNNNSFIIKTTFESNIFNYKIYWQICGFAEA